MKAGNLYRLRTKPKRIYREAWRKYENPCIYLGERHIHRDDGVTVTNYAFLAAGTECIVDRTMLKWFEEVE